jgi:hypothetical protein
VAVATSGATEAPEPQHVEMPPEPPKKKRGFWGRLFGKGGDDERKETKDTVPPKKK